MNHGLIWKGWGIFVEKTAGLGYRGTEFGPEGIRILTEENRDATSSRQALERAMAAQTILEGTAVLCDTAHTLVVELGCMRGIIRRGEAVLCSDGEEVRDIAVITRVGKHVSFVVTGFTRLENGEEVAVLSRREAQRRCRREYLDRLVPGDVIGAKVTHLEQFGAFVDIGCGIVSMLPIDCISVSRIAHPADRFFAGMPICVVIRAMEEGGRISVSHKELLGTWEENAALFSPGQTVTGKVRSIEDYGVFVELTPNLAGLAEYRSDITVGQSAAVYIKNLIPERMKVKLVLIDTYRAESSTPPPKYFIGEGAHIDRWVYSPTCAARVTESVFV